MCRLDLSGGHVLDNKVALIPGSALYPYLPLSLLPALIAHLLDVQQPIAAY